MSSVVVVNVKRNRLVCILGATHVQSSFQEVQVNETLLFMYRCIVTRQFAGYASVLQVLGVLLVFQTFVWRNTHYVTVQPLEACNWLGNRYLTFFPKRVGTSSPYGGRPL